MAQLHRRVLGLPHHALIACAVFFTAATASAQRIDKPLSATASALRLEELRATAEQLGSADPVARADAIATLSSLDADAIRAIEARLPELARVHVPPEEAPRALASFRHVQGSRRADEDVDLELGVPLVLETDRGDRARKMAELILYVRALTRMGTDEAQRALVEVLAVEPEVFRWESRLLVTRHGVALVPAYLAARRHPQRALRAFATNGFREIGLSDPGAAVQQRDPDMLALVLRAFGELREMPAMATVIAFVGDDRVQVRHAARHAASEYGANAVWQLRRAYRNATERDAPRAWAHARLLAELSRVFDERRFAPATREIDVALVARSAGDLASAQAHLDEALRVAPTLPGRDDVAMAYAEIGADHAAHGRNDAALAAYHRAVRLATSDDITRAWRGRIAFLEAERSLARGVVDLHGYERAASLDPAHEPAQARLEALAGGEGRAKWLGLGGAALLVTALLYAWRTRRSTQREPRASGAAAPAPT